MDRDNFFDNLHSDAGGSSEALRALQQLAYEERVIKRVFADCGIKINGWGRFANQCRDITGKDKLNFEWFNQNFRHFPGTLCGARVPGLHKLTMADLFKPRNNRLVKMVAKALHKNGLDVETDSFVFVFPVIRTPFCAHSVTNLKAPDRVCWQMTLEDAALTVEPVNGFCRAISTEWFESQE